jgi:hypothetical protein
MKNFPCADRVCLWRLILSAFILQREAEALHYEYTSAGLIRQNPAQNANFLAGFDEKLD